MIVVVLRFGILPDIGLHGSVRVVEIGLGGFSTFLS